MNWLKKGFRKFVVTCATVTALVVGAVANALAVDPTSLAEVATAVTTDIGTNKGMIFTIMGAVIGIAVLLMIFYKGKRVVK